MIAGEEGKGTVSRETRAGIRGGIPRLCSVHCPPTPTPSPLCVKEAQSTPDSGEPKPGPLGPSWTWGSPLDPGWALSGHWLSGCPQPQWHWALDFWSALSSRSPPWHLHLLPAALSQKSWATIILVTYLCNRTRSCRPGLARFLLRASWAGRAQVSPLHPPTASSP